MELKIYILPALIALAIKLVVLIISRRNIGHSSVFFTMVLVFACHNVAEVLGFLEYFQGKQVDQLIRWYYVMSVCGLVAILSYSNEVSKLYKKSKTFDLTISALAIAGISLIMFTDTIVMGSEAIGYTVTAIRGEFYWVFQLFSITAYSVIIWCLVSGYRHAADHTTEIQCGFTLLALAPLIFIAVGVIGLMSIGIKINAAFVMPIGTTLFLLITLKSEATHRLTDIRRHIPFSLERKTANQIMGIFSRYAQDEVSYREGMNQIEKLLVTHKHDKHGGNVSSTAASMDMPRSSLYSIFRRLEIAGKDTAVGDIRVKKVR